jgi:hypothetical protein
MKDQLTNARSCLQSLDQAVAAGEAGRARRLWGGAGLCVVTAITEDPHVESVKYVVTAYASSLSWLVGELWVGCRALLDSMTKVEFFGRLGNAAQGYLQRAGNDASERDLLGAVVHEAYEIVSDIENGRFCALAVAPAGVVHDDLLPESAHCDAVSSAQIAQWFEAEVPDGESDQGEPLR